VAFATFATRLAGKLYLGKSFEKKILRNIFPILYPDSTGKAHKPAQ